MRCINSEAFLRKHCIIVSYFETFHCFVSNVSLTYIKYFRGGSSMFPGMPNRLQKDIQSRYFKDILNGDKSRVNKCRINVEAPRYVM